MKRWISGIIAAAMLAASPVWAHGGGHGHGHGRGHGHHDERHGAKHWKHGHRDFDRFDDRDVVVIREPRIVERQVTYVEPQPVYVQPPAAINIVVPLR